jgi:hypothetical protein
MTRPVERKAGLADISGEESVDDTMLFVSESTQVGVPTWII